MAMHKYDLEHFLESVKLAGQNLNGSTLMFSNVGDTSYEDFVEMKTAGISGVYHCWRLGEGTDTRIDPEQRKESRTGSPGCIGTYRTGTHAGADGRAYPLQP